MGIPHQQPFSYRRPPLPSTTSSLINGPSPIDDPLSLQRPSSLINNPSPINDPLSHQQPHPSSTTPLLSTNPSPINDLILYQPPPLASTTSSIYQSLPHQHDNPYEEHTPPGFSHSTSCGKSYIRFSF